MSLIRRLASERRALTPQQIWGRGDDAEPGVASGVRVTRETALGLSAVYACVRLLSNVVVTLPLDAYRVIEGKRVPLDPQPGWITQPIPRDPSVTGAVHFQQVVVSQLLDGNSFTLCLPSVFNPAELRVLDPRTVTIKDTPDGSPAYEVRDSRNQVAGTFGPDQIVHIPLLRVPGQKRGISPIEAERQTIGLGLAADAFGASFFGRGATLAGVIETEQEMTPEKAEELKDKFEKKHAGLRNAHRPGVLTGGAKWKQLSVSPDQAQFLESRKYTVTDVARVFGVPPYLIGDNSPGAMSYASVEMLAIEFGKYTVLPLVKPIELAYRQLLPSPDAYLKFNVAALERADIKSRYEAYGIGLDKGFLNANRVQALEDQPSIGSAGDAYRVQMQMVDSGTSDVSAKAKAVQTLVLAGYDPEAALTVVGLPEMPHTGLVKFMPSSAPLQVGDGTQENP